MSRIGYLFARSAFATLRDRLDPRKVNGGVFLGLDGIVIKSHGGTDAIGYAAAIDVGYDMVKYELLAKIQGMLPVHDLADPVTDRPADDTTGLSLDKEPDL